MTATATIRYTTRTGDDARLAIARVAAAGRVQAERLAAEARREAGIAHNRAGVQAWLDQAVAAGAVEVGTKVCLAEGGKWRPTLTLDGAVDALARWIADGDEVEAWGIDARGEYVGDVLGVW